MNIAETIETLKNKGYEPIKPIDVQNVCLFLLGLDIESLKKVIEDKNLPMIFRIVGRELLSEKGFEVVEKLLNRIYGKEFSPAAGNGKFTIELVNAELPKPDLSKLSDIELETLENIMHKTE
jgi:hypothetical protein